MSVFEDLIAELKQDNLIEDSVFETYQSNVKSTELPLEKDENVLADIDERSEESTVREATETAGFAPDDESFEAAPVNENEFYRRRAIEEVTSLQLVERILSGVEREQMKIVSQPFDDIAVGTALHDFLQVSKNSNSPDNTIAEFRLMQETESWYSALSYRDKNILPAHLRRYCETTRPPLSSQALAALARFYRNSPYSEAVRSKFEMVVTRLFSQETSNDEREMVFKHHQIVQHLAELYADWSSVSLYATDNDAELTSINQKFENFVNEANSATAFEELVTGDFFNRLRAFKESTGENFYAPTIAATVIECNIRVGNIYVRLLDKERRKNNTASLENKYSHLLDQTISEATSKTLQLTNLLEDKNSSPAEKDSPPDNKPDEEESILSEKSQPEVVEKGKSFFESVFSINKWLLGAIILIIVLSFGLYSRIEFSEPQADTDGVKNFQMQEYYFKDYLKTAKVVNNNFVGFVSPSWNDIGAEKKQEVLKNILAVGKEKGFKTVRLLNEEGKTIDYAAEDNITTDNSNSAANPDSQ